MFGFSVKTLLCLWLPAAGLLYSNPSYPFKKNRLLALLTITATVFVVALLGYVANFGVFSTSFYFSALTLIITCAGVIPLKDLSDARGDAAYGAENWFSGGGNVILRGSILLALAIVSALYSGQWLALLLTCWNAVLFGLLMILYIKGKIPPDRLYRNVLIAVILGLAVAVGYAVYLRYVSLF